MKKIALILACLGLFSVSMLAQSTQRPRVVSPSPTPPAIKNGVTFPTNQTEKRPPVLQGGRTVPQTSPTPPTADTNAIEDDNEVIKVETNLVTMPVAVLDRDGRFISGLQQKDFKIFENGTEQKIDYFQSV